MEKEDLKQKLKDLLDETVNSIIDGLENEENEENQVEYEKAVEGINKVFKWAFGFVPGSEESKKIMKNNTRSERFSEMHPDLPIMPFNEYDVTSDISIGIYHATKWYYKTVGKDE